MVAEALIDRPHDRPWTQGSDDKMVRMGQEALRLNNFHAAIALFGQALEHSQNAQARCGLVVALLAAKQTESAYAVWRGSADKDRLQTAWLQSQLEAAFESHRFDLAGDIGMLISRVRWASEWWPASGLAEHVPRAVPRDLVTVTKLRHDALQYRYLLAEKLIDPSFDAVIERFDLIADELERERGAEGRCPMSAKLRGSIGNVYNRIVHLGKAERVRQALSDKWSSNDVQAAFRQAGGGVVVIDDFLSGEALRGIHRFAMESTVWSGLRYIHGRLGAFFNDGFNCPLLLQVAEELRSRLPQVVTPRYPLRQIWGFKNSTDLPADSNLHADFAAVNVNFWLTPDACNAEPHTGGMMVYDVDAPLGWDFHTYNGRSDIIKAFLRENAAKAMYVPYRQNRCVLFNSDLFHGTHKVKFKPGFENQRINVTMLFGHREHDAHHPSLSGRQDLQSRWGTQRSAWHSHAFAKHRR